MKFQIGIVFVTPVVVPNCGTYRKFYSCRFLKVFDANTFLFVINFASSAFIKLREVSQHSSFSAVAVEERVGNFEGQSVAHGR